MAHYDFTMTPGEYVYGETATGKYAYGVVRYGATSERNSSAQRAAGGAARLEDDHGGHLIAYCLGGRNDATNLDAQNKNVNQRGQRYIENQVAELAKDPNKTVFMSVENYSSNGQRPDAAMITVAVQDNTTGQIDVEHYSLQNASYEEQAQWDALANENSEVDPRQDEGMTKEERELANQLAEQELPEEKLGEGYTVFFGEESPNTGESLETEGVSEEGESVEEGESAGEESEEGMDGGIDDDDGGMSVD